MQENFLPVACAAFMLACANVGCASSVPSTPLPTRSTESATPTLSVAPTKFVSPTPIQPSGAITLTLWTTRDFAPGATGSGTIWRDQFAAFHTANPNIALEVVLKMADGKGGMVDSLMTTRAAAPTLLPDVAILNASDVAAASDAKILQPLDGVLPDELKSDLFPFASQYANPGQWMAIPFAADLEHMVYNQAAVSPAPRTWDELAKQKAPLLLPLGGDDAFLLQYSSFGASLTSFDAYAATQVFAFVKRGHEQGYLSEACLTTNTPDDAWDAFESKQVAMAQVKASRYLSRRNQLSPTSNAGFAPVPTRDGKGTTLAFAWAFAIITNDPARKSAAAAWIRWLMKPDLLTPFLRAAHELPIYRAMIGATIDSKEYAAFLCELMERAAPMPSSAVYAKKAEAWRAGISAVWRGQMTPEDAAKSIATLK